MEYRNQTCIQCEILKGKDMKKRKGEIDIVVPVFFMVIISIIVIVLFQLLMFSVTRTTTEDALVVSNLASALIDPIEYGKTGNMIIQNPDEAYAIYQSALKTNLHLNDDWSPANDELVIGGPVQVLDYIIYNVKGQDVEIIGYEESAGNVLITGGLGTVTAPTGQVIEKTSIYSKITFPVNGIQGTQVTAIKEKLVAVVEN